MKAKNLKLKIRVTKITVVFMALLLALLPQSVSAACYIKPSYMSYAEFRRLVGGVSLDKAATFIEDMTDITGAYFDQTTNRVVLVGPKRGSSVTPVFNKDDLAVAIRAVVFNNTIPAVSIGSLPPAYSDPQPVNYYGGIENTNFGYQMEQADYKLKEYMTSPVSSGVSGYASIPTRFLAQNPGSGDGSSSWRVWISPKTVSLKLDSATNSFVFDQVEMQVQNQIYSGSTKMVNAINDFTTHVSNNYNTYATEIGSWSKIKDLSKLVAVVKWLKDNNIVTDYNWAKTYQPAYVATPTGVPPFNYSATQGGFIWSFWGGMTYSTPNTYGTDTGTAASLKSAAQSAAPSGDPTHWTFTQSGQDYNTVAVSAKDFESLGGYGTKVTDSYTDTLGDLSLNYERAYNSFASSKQLTSGLGWDNTPARLVNNRYWDYVTCSPSGGYSGNYPKSISFQNIDGVIETFVFDCSTGAYSSLDSSYHSKLVRNTDGSYTVKLKNQIAYKFSNTGMLLLTQTDKNGNHVNYQYGSGTAITKIEDDNSHYLNVNYNTQGLVSSVVDWTGRTTSYTYDSQGKLLTVTDPLSHTTTYTYDTGGRLATTTDRNGHLVLSNTYNSENKVTASTDASGLAKSYTYDSANKIITVTDSNSSTTKTYYDNAARITKIIDPLLNETVYTYGTERSPLTVKDGRGNTTAYTYDPNANLTGITDPNGKSISMTYNSLNEVTQISDGRYGLSPKITNKTYDSSGNLLSVDEAGTTTSYSYNSSGTANQETNARGYVTKYTYNSFGKKLTALDPMGGTITNTYDSLGRIVQAQDQSGKITSFTYDANNNVLTTVTGAGTTTNTYDNENQLISTTTPDSKTTQFAYNNNGSQTSTTEANTSLTSYGYDSYQNIVSRQDALNHTTLYEYDKLNRKTKSTTPLSNVTRWTYDANGNLIKRTDATSRDTTYTYDSLNRLTQVTYPDSSQITYTYDGRGNALTITAPSGVSEYTYDNFDRITSSKDPHNDLVSYAYDSADNLTSITYPNSDVVTYKYDAANRLKSTSDWNGSKQYQNYYPNNQIQSKQFPNGINALYLYDSSNQLTSLNYTRNDGLLTKFAYTRDARGNILTETESKPNATSDFTIYDEGLPSGWSNSWSWNGSFNLSDTTSPNSGTHDIAWSSTGNSGIHIRNTTGTVSTSPYSAVTVAIRSSQANQKLIMNLKDTSDANTSTPIDISVYGGHPITSNYKIYTIPLSAFNANNSSISGLTLEEPSHDSQPNIYIDSIKLTTATPTPITLYDDTVSPEFYTWQWNGSSNTSNTSESYSGASNTTLTASAGWSGIQFQHNADGFSTKGSNALQFALKTMSGTDSPDYTVQLTNSGGTGLAAELDIAKYAGKVGQGDYTVYTIPLVDLNASDKQVYGFILQNQNSSAAPVVKLDDVKIVPTLTTLVTDSQATFTYDSVNRLLTATYPSSSYSYTYDAAGNRTASNENGTSSSYTINNDNQMTAKAGRSFTFDSQGNQISDGSKTLTYDFDNRIKTFAQTGAGTITYKYDGPGNRIEKNIASGNSFQYVNDVSGSLSRVLVNKNVTASTSNTYVYSGDLLSQGGASSSSREYYLSDGLGNIRYVTNNSGSNLHSYTYDPYGNVITGSGSEFSYQGQTRDSEDNLVYLRARYFDSTTGQFLSRDPVNGVLNNPQTQNGYNYANSNPITYTDPSGLWYINIGLGAGWWGAGAGVGVMIGDKGVYPYAAGGVATPGFGLTVSGSPGNATPGWGGNASAYAGFGGSLGTDGNWEFGVGTPGASIMAQYTLNNIICR